MTQEDRLLDYMIDTGRAITSMEVIDLLRTTTPTKIISQAREKAPLRGFTLVSSRVDKINAQGDHIWYKEHWLKEA